MGRPGVWTLVVHDNKVQRTLAPSRGLLSNLLRPATLLSEDPHVAGIRAQNPADFESVGGGVVSAAGAGDMGEQKKE
jgi:hypothetical protein